MKLNPFKPAKIPYMAAPYELNPYSFFGVGIAENMDDTKLMNGFMRMAVDNAVLSGNLSWKLMSKLSWVKTYLCIRAKCLEDKVEHGSSNLWHKVSKRIK